MYAFIYLFIYLFIFYNVHKHIIFKGLILLGGVVSSLLRDSISI